MSIDICKLRKSRGMSQRELADLLQVRQSFLSAIENGRSRLPEEKEDRICEIFGTDAVAACTDVGNENITNDTITSIKSGMSESDIVGQLLRHFHDLAHKADNSHNGNSERVEALSQRNDYLNKRNDQLSERIDILRAEIDSLRKENFHLKELLITNGIEI